MMISCKELLNSVNWITIDDLGGLRVPDSQDQRALLDRLELTDMEGRMDSHGSRQLELYSQKQPQSGGSTGGWTWERLSIRRSSNHPEISDKLVAKVSKPKNLCTSLWV